MRKLALALAATAVCSLSVPTTPAAATVETIEAQMTAASAASIARQDMFDAFGEDSIKPGQYLWRDVPRDAGEERVRAAHGRLDEETLRGEIDALSPIGVAVCVALSKLNQAAR